MKKFSVVISRQFGSLGRPIAKEMSEILGVEYYDRDIVTMVAKAHNITIRALKESLKAIDEAIEIKKAEKGEE